MKLINNALIMPLNGSMDEFTGGIFDRDGKFVEGCLPYRGRQPACAPLEDTLHGTYIWGGCLFGHFGHFIWESLAHLPAIRKCSPDYPILFISPNDRLFNMHRNFFKNMGIRNQIIIVQTPVLVERLIYLPPQSSISPVHISDEQLQALAYFDFRDSKNSSGSVSPKKIWLSRSGLMSEKLRKIVNEPELEQKLAQAGFEIIHPETLPLRQQAGLISTAAVVAGFDGSQFFSVLFAKNSLGHFHVFNSRPHIPETLPYVFEKKKISFSLHNYQVAALDEGKWRNPHMFLAKEPEKILNDLL